MFNSKEYIEPSLGQIIRLPNGFVLEVVERADFYSCDGCYYNIDRCDSPFVCGILREDGKRVMFKKKYRI